MSSVKSFWWISGVPLRESLENDYMELEKCDVAGLNKSTLVLCGSVMEGLLYDATSKHRKANQQTLAELIQTAKDNGVISSETEQVCLLVKDWRNLIHPEKQHRLGILPDDLPQRAKAAKAALEMLVLQLEKSESYVYIDGGLRVREDSKNPENDDWLSLDEQLQCKGMPSLRVEGTGNDATPNAWTIWSSNPVRRKRFFRTQVYIKAESAPEQLMIQFHKAQSGGSPWDHRVYWGKDIIKFGLSYALPRRKLGDLPQFDTWVELVVDLKTDAELDLEKGVDGVALSLAHSNSTARRAVWFGRSTFESER